MLTIKTFNIPALFLKQKMHLQSLQPYMKHTPEKLRMSTIPLSCSNNTLLPSSELIILLHLRYITVTLYNTGALLSINSCLTNAQIILNSFVTNDYLSYSLMITTLETN